MTRIDTQDESQAAFEASVAAAYDPSLSAAKQKQILKHLSFLLKKFHEPNTNIAECREAIRVMELRINSRKKWSERIWATQSLNLLVAVVGGLILAVLLIKLHINAADTPASTSAQKKAAH